MCFATLWVKNIQDQATSTKVGLLQNFLSAKHRADTSNQGMLSIPQSTHHNLASKIFFLLRHFMHSQWYTLEYIPTYFGQLSTAMHVQVQQNSSTDMTGASLYLEHVVLLNPTACNIGTVVHNVSRTAILWYNNVWIVTGGTCFLHVFIFKHTSPGVTSRESSGQHHRKLAKNVVRNRQRNLTRPY